MPKHTLLLSFSLFALLLLLGSKQAKSPALALLHPLALHPTQGSIHGNDLVFLKMREKGAPGQHKLRLRFGKALSPACRYDARLKRYLCRVPAHTRAETVALSIHSGGRSQAWKGAHYTYTTDGKQDMPLLRLKASVLRQNAARIRRKLPANVRLSAVIKNGDPVEEFARAFHKGAKLDYVCVPKLQDGIALRKAGFQGPIMVLYLTPARHVLQLLHYRLEPAALSHHWIKEANAILKSTNNATLGVHLWIDTGMGREGVMPAEAPALAKQIHNSPQLKLKGIGTHFCCLGKKDAKGLATKDPNNRTVQQKQRFDAAIAKIRAQNIGKDAIVHAGTSDALDYKLKSIYYDMLRVGTMFFHNPTGRPQNYSWKTRILQIKTLPPGWCIDYECTTKTKKSMRVGLLTHITGDVSYYIHGKEVSSILDHEYVITLDLSKRPDVKEGDEVALVFDDDGDNTLDIPPPIPATVTQTTSKKSE